MKSDLHFKSFRIKGGLKESEQGQVQKDKERLKTGEGNLYVFYMLLSTMKCEPYFPIIYVCMKFM